MSRLGVAALIFSVLSLAAGAFSAGYNLGVGMATLKCYGSASARLPVDGK